MESLLGDIPLPDHPPLGKERLLYLGIGYRPEARFINSMASLIGPGAARTLTDL